MQSLQWGYAYRVAPQQKAGFMDCRIGVLAVDEVCYNYPLNGRQAGLFLLVIAVVNICYELYQVAIFRGKYLSKFKR